MQDSLNDVNDAASKSNKIDPFNGRAEVGTQYNRNKTLSNYYAPDKALSNAVAVSEKTKDAHKGDGSFIATIVCLFGVAGSSILLHLEMTAVIDFIGVAPSAVLLGAFCLGSIVSGIFTIASYTMEKKVTEQAHKNRILTWKGVQNLGKITGKMAGVIKEDDKFIQKNLTKATGDIITADRKLTETLVKSKSLDNKIKTINSTYSHNTGQTPINEADRKYQEMKAAAGTLLSLDASGENPQLVF